MNGVGFPAHGVKSRDRMPHILIAFVVLPHCHPGGLADSTFLNEVDGVGKVKICR